MNTKNQLTDDELSKVSGGTENAYDTEIHESYRFTCVGCGCDFDVDWGVRECICPGCNKRYTI